MAWTAPMTAVANAVLTAAQWNTHVRDNLNETAVAKATTAGRIFVSTGVNTLAEREIGSDQVLTNETTTAGSATDLATVGPTVTVTTGTTAILAWSCEMSNNVGGAWSLMDFTVSGATTRAASDDTALKYESSNASDLIAFSKIERVTGLTAGSNTFRSKYWISSGTGAFQRRKLVVIAL